MKMNSLFSFYREDCTIFHSCMLYLEPGSNFTVVPFKGYLGVNKRVKLFLVLAKALNLDGKHNASIATVGT